MILNMDCLLGMKALADNSVDAIVTDPPYGLSFMGKRWDYDVPSVEVWAECLRVLKPGGHLLAFAGTRTQHRMAVRIEDAGFEIRDMIAWVYGSGFPKSLDVSKAIDKAAGAEREILGFRDRRSMHDGAQRNSSAGETKTQCGGRAASVTETVPATEAARQWEGWGTALKPALEPITVARKPLIGTVAENVLAHDTGALNIDGCRVPTNDRLGGGMVSMGRPKASEGWDRPWMHDVEITKRKKAEAAEKVAAAEALGRWPANLIHDGSDEVLAAFPNAKGQQGAVTGDEPSSKTNAVYGAFSGRPASEPRGDMGTAARFFYCAKASKRDRDEGLEQFADSVAGVKNGSGRGFSEGDPYAQGVRKNNHPTVKPTDLMRYLCRLVTPPGGFVLDPFAGSGSTGKACKLEGFAFMGFELDPDYAAIAKARIT